MVFLTLLNLDTKVMMTNNIFSFVIRLNIVSSFTSHARANGRVLVCRSVMTTNTVLKGLFRVFRIGLPKEVVFLTVCKLFKKVFINY